MNNRQKEKQIKLNNKKLCEEYPFLIPRNRWTGKIRSDYDYSYTEWDNMPKGWRLAFGDMFLEELKESLIKNNYLHQFRITQIKEKYGSLRFYTFGCPRETLDVINKYEFISQYICINCGKPDSPIINNYGWYEPVCKDCFEKSPFKKFTYEELLNKEDTTLPSSYTISTYGNGMAQKTTYDITETTNKIRELHEKRRNKKC